MAKTLMYVEGNNGQVELTEDRIIIHRKGILNIFSYGLNASHEVPLISVSGVDFKNASMLTMGSIEFDHPGNAGGASHKNEVKFTKKHREEFLALKERVFEIIEANRKQH